VAVWWAPVTQGVLDDSEDVVAWFDAVDRDKNPWFPNTSNFVIGNHLLATEWPREGPFFFENSKPWRWP
jgi:hypothetical protein